MATEVCSGDTTLLTAIVNTADSVVLITWDLDGDGLFGDAYGDTVRHIYPHAGIYSVGARLTTLPGNISTVYQSVMVGDEPDVDFIVETPCVGLPTLFTPQIGLLVGEPDSIIWIFGDQSIPSNIVNPLHSYTSPGIFNVTLSVISTIGCENSISKDVLIYPLPAFNLMWSNDTIMAQGDSLILTVQGDVDSVLWSNGHRGTQIVVYQPGFYAATAYLYGCYDTKGVNVSFRETTTVAMLPNVITANGDGFNDCWVISDRTIARPVEVSIFNRLGQMVFFSADYNDNWCGSKQGAPLPPGTYFYIVKLPGNRVIQGYVDLLR